VHETLASLYDLPPEERKLDNAQHLFRQLWRKRRRTARYGPLFGLTPPPKAGVEATEERRDHVHVERERAWGLKGFEALRLYFQLEDPPHVEPLGCEERVAAKITGVSDTHAAIPVTGTIDRLDETTGGLVIVDYKTGRSPAARFRERGDLFFQLEVYALLLSASGRWENPATHPATLRLIFLGDGAMLEKTVGQRDIEATEQQLRAVYAEMLVAFSTGSFTPCNRAGCFACGANGNGANSAGAARQLAAPAAPGQPRQSRGDRPPRRR
jgi:hypothetical protein